MVQKFLQFVSSVVMAGACLPPAWAGSEDVKEITIRVFNSAKVSKGDLAGALKVASAIYAEAGIGITWEQGSDDDHESKALDFSAYRASDGACAGRRLGGVNLGLDRAPTSGVNNNTLGFALPCARYGTDASVFVDRCEGVMQGTTASFGKILGHAIAHEVGHVLLGTNGHSVGGLMRARWGRAEWQTVAAAHLAIAPADAEKMAASLLLYGQSGKTTTGAR
jgi:hypothetical protein